MTEHTHTTIVAGCFRCDLNKDEMGVDEPRPIRRTIIIPDPAMPEVLDRRPDCAVGVVHEIAALAVMNA